MYENGRQLVERVVHVLQHAPSGLFTDIDGTISPIVERGEDAHVEPRARQALQHLARQLTSVGVLTGRITDDARRMLGLDNLVYVGNHGLEVDGEVVPEARPWIPRVQTVLHALETDLNATLPGVRFEDKGVTLSVHYRGTADHAAARDTIARLLREHAGNTGLRIEEGRLVFNVLPPLDLDKGSALASVVRRRALQGVVYLGDDVTDTHVFRALAALRDRQGIETLTIGIVGSETATSVEQLSDATLPNVQAVADVLCAVLERLQAGGSMSSGTTQPTPE